MAINIQRSLRNLLFLLSSILMITFATMGFSADMIIGPKLSIETGTHTARIMSMAVSTDKSPHFIVTGSIDKTVRVWKVDNGENALELVDTIRPPLGNGGVGHIYAVAISPNGKLIACGGWTVENEKFSIYIYRKQRDKDKFEFLKAISGLPNSMIHLAFNERYLIVGLSPKTELQIYRLSDAALVASDKKDEKDKQYAEDERIKTINLTKKGILTLSNKGTMRLYDLDWMKLDEVKKSYIEPVPIKIPGIDIKAASYSFHEKRGRIAIGWLDQVKSKGKYYISAFDEDALKNIEAKVFREPTTPYQQIPQPEKVVWSTSGKALYVLGGDEKKIYKHGVTYQGKEIIIVKDIGDSITIDNKEIQYIDNFIMSKGEVEDNSKDEVEDNIIFVFNRVDLGYYKNKTKNNKIDSKAINFDKLAAEMKRDPQKDLIVSDDGMAIWYSANTSTRYHATIDDTVDTKQTYTYNASDYIAKNRAKIISCNTTTIGNSTTITLEQALNTGEVQEFGCLGVLVKDDFYLIGTRWNFRVYNKDGKEELKSRLSLPAPVYSLKLVQNDKVAVAALGDGTIRWYRITEKKNLVEILSFFPKNGEVAGIFWTPSGYFATNIKEFADFGFHNNLSKDELVGFQSCCDEKFESSYGRRRQGNTFFRWILETLDEDQALEKIRFQELSECRKGEWPQISPWFPEMKDRLTNYAEWRDKALSYLEKLKEETEDFEKLIEICEHDSGNDTIKIDAAQSKCEKSPLATLLKNEDITFENIKIRKNKVKIVRAKELLKDLKSQVDDLSADLRSYPTTTATTKPQSAQLTLYRLDDEKMRTRTNEGEKIVVPNITVATRGSWDTELLAGVTDFIFERAEQELIRWYVAQWTEHFCRDGSSNMNSWELCKLRTDSKEHEIISRSDLYQAIRNDLENMPAGIVCNLNMNRDQQFFSYVMIDLLKKVSRGAVPANMIAGLGESEDVRKECFDGRRRPLACSLYMSGVIMQAYLGAAEARNHKKIYWNDVFLQANEKLDHDLKIDPKNKEKLDDRPTNKEKLDDLKLRLVRKHVEITRALTRYNDLLQNQQIIARDLERLTSDTAKSAYADRLLLAIRMSRSVVEIVSSMRPVMDIRPDTLESLEYARLMSNSTAALVSGQYADAAKSIRDMINGSSDFSMGLN